jgi:hypothetical protein
MLVCEARKKIERMFTSLDPLINKQDMMEAEPSAPLMYDVAAFCSQYEYSERMAMAVRAQQRQLGLVN